ncbi:MAG: serine/threonine protein kinase [Lachnospiraceae bacterium]|nr:serine/threonine protein kinase [Lachnospiraceae bacterium]
MDIIFNEYYNLRSLGKGSFASVFKAKHIELGYIRAVKVSKDIVTGENDKAWQTFLKECKLLLQIGNGSHPNIVRIYQPRRIGNNALVEMDYIDGESMHDYIEQSDYFLPVDEVNRLTHDIVSALAYCHVDLYKFLMDPVEDNLQPDPLNGRKYIVSPEKEKELINKYGVVHNDLHSGNIMRRDYDGAYILLDFGLAKQDDHFVKSSSRNDGSREYCPPEKFDGKELTTASDVYSLGILLYEALAGDVPFKAPENGSPESKASALENAHKYSDPPSIFSLRKAAFERKYPDREYVQDYPDKLEKIILKCLAKNPAERYQNAKELQRALLSIPTQGGAYEMDTAINKHLQDEVSRLNSELSRAKIRVRELKAGQSLVPHNSDPGMSKALQKARLHSRGWKRFSMFLLALLLIIGIAGAMWYVGWIKFLPPAARKYAYPDSQFADSVRVEERIRTVDRVVRDTVQVVQHDTVQVEVPVEVPAAEEDRPSGPIPELHISEHLNDLIRKIPSL